MGNKANLNKGNPDYAFTSENQPSPEAKKKGWQKKRLLKDLADILLQGDKLKEFKLLANDLGIDLNDDEMTFEIAMSLKQAEKAIQKGDTSAYNSVMDRLKGRPMQAIDHTSKGQSISQPILNIDPLSQTEND